MSGWIGVDLDGTLAQYDGWRGAAFIGAPVPAMVERIQRWLANDIEVRIVTARVSASPIDRARQEEVVVARAAIIAWCQEHIGVTLPVTCQKDMSMIELWDDRVVLVEANTGKQLTRSYLPEGLT